MQPLVTAIMLTNRARRRFIPQAVNSFLAQTYGRSLLLVVQEELGDVEDLLPVNARILPLARSGCIGAKRNFACEAAQSPLIAHWDDDDWSAPERLRVQVEALEANPNAVLTGFRKLLFFDETTGKTWRYDGRSLYAAGTTFCYRRDYWLQHRFEEIQVQEDNHFLDEARKHGLVILERCDLMVARIHSGNTSVKLGSPQWKPFPASALPGEFPSCV